MSINFDEKKEERIAIAKMDMHEHMNESQLYNELLN